MDFAVVDFLIVILIIAGFVVGWVALIWRRQRQATSDEMAGWFPRSRRRRRRSGRDADRS